MEYTFASADASCASAYLLPAVRQILKRLGPASRVMDLGCGNGSFAVALAQDGFDVVGVDQSVTGLAFARESAREANVACQLVPGSVYDDLSETHGYFDVVVSLEVIEHLFSPLAYAKTVEKLLKPDGVAIISTPYHGYIKNLAISLSGQWDKHHGVLWEGGHIKFWSRQTLRQLFSDVGLTEVAFTRVGRIPVLAKSMISVFSRLRDLS